MRPGRIWELQELLAQSYPEYYTLYKSIWNGNIFSYKGSPSEEAIIILKAVNKFEHLLVL